MASNPSRSRNKCGRSIFRDLLVEEYKKKPKNINVVEKKRQKFQLNLFKAHKPYLDELQLCADIYYCINCCFCYCCVMDALARKDKKFYDMAEKLIRELSEKESDKLFPKFLQVLFHFERKDWAMTLQWCKAVETHEDDFEKQCVQIDITRTVLPSGTTLIDESRLYEEKAFFNHWEDMVKIRLAESPNKKYKFLLKEINILMKLIKLDTSFPTSELQNIFNEDVVPLWQGSKEIDPEKDSYQCSDCMLKEMFDISILDNKQAEEAALLQAGFIVNLEPSIIDKLQEFRYLVTKEMNLNLIEDETGITGEIKLPSETLPKLYNSDTNR
ncbi:hypothetical protein NQ318_017953 [Aromia moschata]|uniref:Uncharacterized protein n=1 Tax=Aromia moschata TaxID=1265417 RepID=A0AAV8Y227_9CUCU|nr:hypothetical protein NQ318_017953 [Aromia moschata]